MKTKKIPYYILLASLTIGASLILGFLSFGGAFALWPVLLPAFAAFGLSVAYEGEIYLQNIKGALNKLFFKRDYLKSFLANEYLSKNFPDTNVANCPQFFKDYEIQLNLLHLFDHKRLDKEDEAKKRQVEKILRNMEKWFTYQLFRDSTENLSPYEETLREWLEQHKQAKWQLIYEQRRSTFNKVKLFSLSSAIFMALGTTYLLTGVFATIPFLATIPFAMLPFFVVPMAIVAGAAYGLLTYNSITDMINNKTVKKWYNKIRKNLSEGITPRSVLFASAAVLLVALAVALTICTAGTWWTVVKNSRPIFSWLAKMPNFIMGIIHPIITGLSSLVFNLENTSETLEMGYQATKPKKHSHPEKEDDIEKGFFASIGESISAHWQKLREKENWLQIFNPFRILLKLTITPLRILFFLGHLVSIGITADRVPGIPELLSAILGFISEFFEDAHYFLDFHGHNHGGHDHSHKAQNKDHQELINEVVEDHHYFLEHSHDSHDHSHEAQNQNHREDNAHHTKKLIKERLQSGGGHNHDADIPIRILKFVFTPLYALAAVWDSWASQRNQGHDTQETLSFKAAFDKQRGLKKIRHVDLTDEANPSLDWQTHHAIYRIERFKEKHLQKAVWNKEMANEKITALSDLQNDLRKGDVTEKLQRAKANPIYHQQRFFSSHDETTSTENFLEALPSQISPAA